ncbi:MAG: hypothetical protein Kow0025_05650 [Thermodesulfovibrionales bacterium]
MPHFGLMDPGALGPEKAALQRARLHIRAGRRRLRQGKISAGIVTIYDALVHAMEWYALSPERRKGLKVKEGEKLNDERALFRVLVRSGVLDGSFDYSTMDSLVEEALLGDMAGFDYRPVLSAVESALTQLGVMPFDEAGLPAEDPATF